MSDDTPLTLEQCREKRLKLAEGILALLVAFTEETDLHVDCVEVTSKKVTDKGDLCSYYTVGINVGL